MKSRSRNIESSSRSSWKLGIKNSMDEIDIFVQPSYVQLPSSARKSVVIIMNFLRKRCNCSSRMTVMEDELDMQDLLRK